MIRDMLRQKGAVLALTALALPILVCVTGLAVDLGNIYLQRSMLQNSADAAALAGAEIYRDKTENVNSHTQADDMAKQYIKNNQITPNSIKCTAKSQNATTYYRVLLGKDVPLYFLKAFYPKDSFPIQAESIASIGPSSTNPPQTLSPYLFIFKNNLSNVNSINSPDNFTYPGKILCSFDGSVIYTNTNPNLQYSTQTTKLDHFFTRKAFDDGLSVQDALNKPVAVYDKTTGQTTTAGYSHQASYSTYDYNRLSKAISDKATSSGSVNIKEQTLNASDINKNNQSKFVFTDTVTININEELKGDINTPIYIYVQKNADIVHIQLSTDTRRPIFIYVEGNQGNPSANYRNAKMTFDLNGHTFRGIVCAPYIGDGGILLHANNGTFSGTIAAAGIDLQSSTGHFKYENFGTSGSGSSSDSSSISGTIQLVNSPKGLSWD